MDDKTIMLTPKQHAHRLRELAASVDTPAYMCQELRAAADFLDPEGPSLASKITRAILNDPASDKEDAVGITALVTVVNDLQSLDDPEPSESFSPRERTAYIKGVADAQGRYLLRLSGQT